MKKEINSKVVAAVVCVVVLVIIGLGWKMFSSGHETQGEREAYFAAHPEAKAAYENMHKMGQSKSTVPPPNVNIGRRGSP